MASSQSLSNIEAVIESSAVDLLGLFWVTSSKPSEKLGASGASLYPLDSLMSSIVRILGSLLPPSPEMPCQNKKEEKCWEKPFVLNLLIEYVKIVFIKTAHTFALSSNFLAASRPLLS